VRGLVRAELIQPQREEAEPRGQIRVTAGS
jgi:hypothetical protein